MKVKEEKVKANNIASKPQMVENQKINTLKTKEKVKSYSKKEPVLNV